MSFFKAFKELKTVSEGDNYHSFYSVSELILG